MKSPFFPRKDAKIPHIALGLSAKSQYFPFLLLFSFSFSLSLSFPLTLPLPFSFSLSASETIPLHYFC